MLRYDSCDMRRVWVIPGCRVDHLDASVLSRPHTSPALFASPFDRDDGYDVVATGGGSDTRTLEGRVNALFPYVAGSAAFVGAGVRPFPGSLYTGIPSHDEFIAQVYDVLHFTPVFGPSALITKYNELGDPALTHALPGAVWCAPLRVATPSGIEEAFLTARRIGSAGVCSRRRPHSWSGTRSSTPRRLPADIHDFRGHSGGMQTP